MFSVFFFLEMDGVDGAISVRKGEIALFWRSCFGDESSVVDWTRFIMAVRAHYGGGDGVDESEGRLRFVMDTLALRSQVPGSVYLAQFQLYTAVFGPLNPSLKSLGEVSHLCHGAKTSSEVAQILADEPVGTFLLRIRRFSVDQAVLALSARSEQGLFHANIYNDPATGGWYTDRGEEKTAAQPMLYRTISGFIDSYPFCLRPLESTEWRNFISTFRATKSDGKSGSWATGDKYRVRHDDSRCVVGFLFCCCCCLPCE